jgi:RHH-type transcriptional regulator, rel operon repressor / antitoxin RelB
MSTTLTIRIDEATKNRLENLSRSTARSRSFLASKAIQEYLEANEWQVVALRETLGKADSPKAHFIEHEKIINWLETWGSENEVDPPK